MDSMRWMQGRQGHHTDRTEFILYYRGMCASSKMSENIQRRMYHTFSRRMALSRCDIDVVQRYTTHGVVMVYAVWALTCSFSAEIKTLRRPL